MLLVGILGQIFGFLIFILFCYLIYHSIKFHPQNFALEDGEEVIKHVKGDYWQKVLTQEVQSHGEFMFTNKRVMFSTVFRWFGGDNISIPYNTIVSVEKANVKGFLPVAIKIKTVDDKTYKFAIMKRDIYIDIINSAAKKEDQD